MTTKRNRVTQSPAITSDLSIALEAAIAAAHEAGDMLRAEMYRPGGPRGRGSHADIDVEVERVLKRRLLAARPWNWLGEETEPKEDAGCPYWWVVDPHDGTRAFLQGYRGTAVSIAVIRDGQPVLGVVYSFSWPDDNGDLIAWAEGCGPITRNGRPVEVKLSNRKLAKGETVLVSQAAPENPVPNSIAVVPACFMAMPGIAYRLALVAVGEAVGCVSLNSPVAWDFAAGHALVRAGGGVLLNERGQEVIYDRRGRANVQYCFGGAPAAAQELVGRNWSAVFKPAMRVSRPILQQHRHVGVALARAQGCLIGQLAGDALGSLVEFQSASEITARYPTGVRAMRDGGTWSTIAGQPTDDSELALSLARRIATDGEWNADGVLEAYVNWFKSAPFDIGGTTSAALEAAARHPGEKVMAASRAADQKSQANGSLMRVSPIGIFAAGRPDIAAQLAAQDSALTHPNPVCVAACSAFAAAISVGVAGGCRVDMLKAALEYAGRGDGAGAVRDRIRLAGNSLPQDYQSQQGWVLIALQNAFHWLANGTGVEDAIVRTIAKGGDTDTNAAIVGALVGAADGRSAFPADWVRALLTCRPIMEAGAKRARPAEFWPDDALELAEQVLVAGGYKPSMELTRVIRCHRDLMTDEERGMALGMGALMAADRLGMTYLADVNTVRELLDGFRQRALQAQTDLVGEAFNEAMLDLESEMANIFAGRDDRYFAIDWFSTEQLGNRLLNQGGLGDDGDHDDVIQAGARVFLTACLESVEQASATNGPKEDFLAQTEEFLKRQTELWMGLPADSLDRQPPQDVEEEPEEAVNVPRPPRAYRDGQAVVDSQVYADDVQELVAAGRRLIALWTRSGTERLYPDPEFDEFHDWLYHAGFVMSDFDGPQFAGGPLNLLYEARLAPLLAQKANLLTIRMFFHTMARAFRHSDCGSGYAHFEDAFRSGGLEGLLDRLEQLLYQDDGGIRGCGRQER